MSSPTAARVPRRRTLALPAPPPADPEPSTYPIRERRIVTRRYPVDEPTWIKCGVAGCGMYVSRNNMNDHLDMHDAAAMQAEEEQRARRLGLMPSRGGPGFPSSGGQYPSARALKRLGYGPMMGDEFDGASTISGKSGSNASSMAGSAATGKHGKHGSGSQAGKGDKEGDGSSSSKDRKNSARKNDARGWSRSSASGKGKDSSGKSVKSSSSSVMSSASKARSDRGKGGSGQGGSGSSKSGRNGSRGSGGSGGGGGGGGGNGGNGGNGGEGGGGNGGGGSGNGSGGPGNGNGPNGPNGPNGNQPPGSEPGSGGPMDPFFAQGGPGSPDMGGLELQLAKLLLANRANPSAPSSMPGSGPNVAPNMAPPQAPGGSNPQMPSNPMSPNDLMQAIMKSVRPQSRNPNPFGMDQRIPSEAANLLAAIVASRSGGY